MQVTDYAVLVGYFVVVIVLGLVAARRIKTQEDYFLGGRSFGKVLQTFAAFGAGTGAHEPVAVGRTVWTSGLSGVWSALLWLFVTPIYWITAVWYRRMRHLTLGDWFVERYESRALGAAYTVFAIVFYMFYLSTMLSAISKFAVPLIGVATVGGVDLKYILVPILAGTVIVYGVLGGLKAAYWTDLLQGVFIIVLSVVLIPFGLWALVKEFGDPSQQGVFDGFSILHQRVSGDYFSLLSGPVSGEFPVQYIVSLTLLALIGIVVQPHFIATGGGSAKTEDGARIGLVVGNFLKRLCTVGWALTGLIALALLAGSIDVVQDPDRLWGVAAREILGPLNLGLVGLMFACLMAAMMSSADTYMLVTSGLVVRNVYAAYFNPQASEERYVAVGRLSGLVVIAGAAFVAVTYADVFGQFQMAVEIPILFAAPFWIGMYWRRATTTAIWGTIAFSSLVFFILPLILPAMIPELRTHPQFALSTAIVTTTFERPATAVDVARSQGWQQARTEALAIEDESARSQVLSKIGSEPPSGAIGELINVSVRSGGQAIFWRGGLSRTDGQPAIETKTIEDRTEQGTRVLVEQQTGQLRGEGTFNLDFVVYSWLGVDLSRASRATLETLRLPPRLVAPFLVLMLLSLVTSRNNQQALDRYYAKMKTEVRGDVQADHAALEAAYADPSRLEPQKLFPGSDWEFSRPRIKDVAGVLISFIVCFGIVALLVWLAGIGS